MEFTAKVNAEGKAFVKIVSDIFDDLVVKGWWTDTKNTKITEATIEDKVRFHIETKDILGGEILSLTIRDWDGKLNIDDYPKGAPNSVTINSNKGYIEFTIPKKWENDIIDDVGTEIELYFDIKYKDKSYELPKTTNDYLKVFGVPEVITVLIELPHSKYTDKLNSKGLGGHSAIMIGKEYYDFGPQPGEPFFSDGRPWWDNMSTSGNLKRVDVMSILGDLKSRKNWNIVGEVFLIDIEISKKEKEAIEKWWIEKYKDLGTYSVIPVFGEQCTTNVRLSLSKCTEVINHFTLKVQTPKGLYDLLTNSAKHTYGNKTKQQLTVTKKYSEI